MMRSSALIKLNGKRNRVQIFSDLKEFEEATRLEKLPLDLWPVCEIVDEEGKTKYRCPWPLCDETGKTNKSLFRHMYSHVPDSHKPFLCEEEECGRGFASSHDLEIHEQTHTIKHCPWANCNETFTRKSHLAAHIKQHENHSTKKEVKKRKSARGQATEEKWKQEECEIREKIKKLREQGIQWALPQNCVLQGDQLYQKCEHCECYKERTSRNFLPANYKGKNFDVINQIFHLCRTCANKLRMEKEVGERYIRKIAHRYLDDGLTKEIVKKKLAEQNYRGLITGVKLKLEPNTDNAISIHRYDNKKTEHPHEEKNIFLEVCELNIAQHDAIPSLFTSYTQLYAHLKTGFLVPFLESDTRVAAFRLAISQTPSDMGIEGPDRRKTMDEDHLPTVLRHRIRKAYDADCAKKELGLTKLTGEARDQYLNKVFVSAWHKLEAQRFVCAYSGLPLSASLGFNQLSIENLDNDRPHFEADGTMSNSVFICRLFNNRVQLSPQKLWYYFINQSLLPIPWVRLTNEEREQAKVQLKRFEDSCAKTIFDVLDMVTNVV
jgi:hypothetical protein